MGEPKPDVTVMDHQKTNTSSERSTPSSNLSASSKTIVRKVKKEKDASLLKRLTRWLLNNQIGLSFNLIALLFLTHISMPKARPFTVKFFTLSHYNPNTGKYALGHGDGLFMIFWVTFLTGLRAAFMEYILAPLAKRLGVAKKKDATRFAEQGWMLIYYSVFWPLGMYIYCKSPYFLDMRQLWTDWPQRELDGLMKGYMLGQWAFWYHQVLVINVEDRRKDHWQMLSHHLVTIALICASYAYHQTRVGNLILVTMDVVDLIFPLAKCLKYLGYTTVCDILFGMFVALWLVSRHVFYMMTCWSVYSDFPKEVPPSCYHGTADNLQGPFPVPDGWSHLLEPFRDPAGTVCLNNNIMYGFLTCLLTLEVMMIMWSFFIIRVAVRVLKGYSAEDIRSDDEEENAEEEHVEYEEVEALEEEVGVEDIDLKGWERRTAGKRAASSSGVSSSLPRNRDRKELLNRIGCEKQIS